MRKYVSIIALIICFTCVFALASCDKSEPQKDVGDIFYLTYNGTKIELGANAAPAIAALGEPIETKSLGDCGGFGAQVKYVYEDIEIFTLKNEEGETIDGIKFINDILATSKGIAIGDQSSKVIEEYGEPTTKSENELLYRKDNLYIKFKLADGEVSDIDYLRETK